MHLLPLLFLAPYLLTSFAQTLSPTCQTTCGDQEISYPFGIGDGCYTTDYPGNFSLSCKNNITYLGGSDNIQVMNIDITGGKVRVMSSTGYDCYDERGNRSSYSPSIHLGKPFMFSNSANRLYVVGCDTVGRIIGLEGVNYSGGCLSFCESKESVVSLSNNDHSQGCSGLGCCDVSIPFGLTIFATQMDSFNNYSGVMTFNRCGYMFMGEFGEYVFMEEDLGPEKLKSKMMPYTLDWSIGNLTCVEANTSRTIPYACRSENSQCEESNNGVGYLCKCAQGYSGNPYLPGGCKDVDECFWRSYSCPEKSTCVNTNGSYTCQCAKGYRRIENSAGGTTCEDINECKDNPCSVEQYCENTDGGFECKSRNSSLSLGLKLGLGIGGALLVLLVVSVFIYWGYQRKKFKEHATKMAEFKKRMFEQNGGPLLQQHISSQPGNGFKIFTEDDLVKATNNFSDDHIIGRGGHGIVYLGTLEDNKRVAVKKSKMMDERESKEFVREMAILSQINHVNVVKIMGCCVEVEVPMLVYEFVPGGTLYELIHGQKGNTFISFSIRYRILQEVAEALAYLHSYASPPILHKDVKTSNVLLDENNRVKISDFGASSIAPVDEAEIATVVQGTCGYLDPEYLQTYQFSDKSDVYSFGVVLVEVLTGRKPFQLLHAEDQRGLVPTFISFLYQGKLESILDPQIVKEVDAETLRELGDLVGRCLCVKRTDRPTMKEVSMALQILGSSCDHPWVPQHTAFEVKNLLDCESDDVPSSYVGTSYHQINDIEAGR